MNTDNASNIKPSPSAEFRRAMWEVRETGICSMLDRQGVENAMRGMTLDEEADELHEMGLAGYHNFISSWDPSADAPGPAAA